MRQSLKRSVSLALATALAGCATASKDITPAYVSPARYQSSDCEQIAAEAARTQTRLTQLGGSLDKAALHDREMAGVGLLLFWPALFSLGGKKRQEAEYARLKGEYDALKTASIAKKCLDYKT